MAGGKQTASETRSAIIVLFNNGKSRNEISKQLNLARCTVQRWMSEVLKNGCSGTPTQKKRSGRPRKTSKWTDILLKCSVMIQLTLTAKEIKLEHYYLLKDV